MADRHQGSQWGFLLDNENNKKEHTTTQNRMGDVCDHDDETILLVNHHDRATNQDATCRSSQWWLTKHESAG